METDPLNPPSSAAKINTPSPSPSPSPPPVRSEIKQRDFLNHVESFLSKRDGIDKLLKISRYASKIIIASSILPETLPITNRLKSFESSVGVSRKAFRLGKFIQDINALRNGCFHSNLDLILSILAYGGEGIYYFIEQFIWLSKSGLIDPKLSRDLQKLSACAELIGYVGSISLKIRDLNEISEEEIRIRSSVDVGMIRGEKCGELEEKIGKVKRKELMKKLSVIQDIADGLMAIADIRDVKGPLSGPLLLSSAGLLSAIISVHKNWLAC
ncbi:peroxisomal membrane protein 11A [Impatiens glandulifera]|uniref:peroxisomal membrane protein 11A n=1 Tax=Impatiens glandulifera TaxID=253017 RepID=UPI001FB1539D|nr:peroxisomal membrane protein 11A [Impatiens glandulifera]